MRFALALALVASSGARAEDITVAVAISSQDPRGSVSGDFNFSLSVTSRFVIERLSVRFNGEETDIATNAFAGTFTGSISIANVADGTYPLVAVARDVNQSVSTAGVLVKIDRSSPPDLDAHLADVSIRYSSENRRQFEISARCLSPAGSKCDVQASGLWSEWNGRGYEAKSDIIKGSRAGSIDLKVCLDVPDGARVVLGAAAFNQTGNSDSQGAVAPLELAPGLTGEVIVPGTILDTDGDRVLFVRNGRAVLKTLSAGSEVELGETSDWVAVDDAFYRPSRAYFKNFYGWLFSRGALYLLNNEVIEFRNGSNQNLGPTQNVPEVRGEYARWLTPAGEWVTRDLASGANIPTIVGTMLGAGGQFAPPPNATTGFDIKTDGTNTVWVERTQVIVLQTPGGRFEFDNGTPSSGLSYAVAGGWLAFVLTNGPSANQVQLRSPDGAVQLVTQWGSPSSVEAVSPTGEFVSHRDGRRHLDSLDIEDIDIGTEQGTVRWSGGTWFKWHESALFRVTPEGNPVPVKSCPAAAGQCSTTGTALLPALIALWVLTCPKRKLQGPPRGTY